MKFNEKLQLLRDNMKLSQEELANMLDVSRQSVTKWENGQSFPNIQKLIGLSNLFHISIDRLVKENDDCNINLSEKIEYRSQNYKDFLIKAKSDTYVTGNNQTASSRLNSHDFRYAEDDFIYIDTYLGGEKFIGEECVWIKDTPVWGMNYYGQTLSDNFDSDFFKEALSRVTSSMPFRGPELYRKGDYTYHCQVHGNFECFTGEEQVYCRQEKVYMCNFHGGVL